MPDRQRQIALKALHGLVQFGVDLILDRPLRLQQALKNVDQFRELVFHAVLESCTSGADDRMGNYAMLCLKSQ